jgi:hypothetical protein
MHDLPVAIVPGGVTLPPVEGEDLGTVQSIGARFALGEVTLEHARQMTCRACAGAGGGCQFLGTAATSQVVAEALGLTLPHFSSGQAIWLMCPARPPCANVSTELDGRAVADERITAQRDGTAAFEGPRICCCTFLRSRGGG